MTIVLIPLANGAIGLADYMRNLTPSSCSLRFREKSYPPMMKSNTFPLPETHPKATANDGRGLSCVEKKGGGKSTREDDCSCRTSTSFNSTTPRTSCSRLEKPPQARFTVLKSSQYPATWFVSCSLL